MSKLQQLLDEKWPLEYNQSESDRLYEMKRKAFTEGYNAAKEEAKAGQVSDDDLRLFHARMQENVHPTNKPLTHE